MAELPMDLKKLETVRGAFEILKYLYNQPDYAADGDDVMDDLDISVRRFDKAKRRLVTRSYIQMRSDYTYELTRKGTESAEALIAFDNADGSGDDGGIERQLILSLPRNFVYGTTSPVKIGIEPSDEFTNRSSLIVRIAPTYATLGEYNEMATLGSDALILETTITPEAYDQARLKVEVYQMSDDGNDFNEVGGMFVDVVVLPEGDTGENIAYATDLVF